MLKRSHICKLVDVLDRGGIRWNLGPGHYGPSIGNSKIEYRNHGQRNAPWGGQADWIVTPKLAALVVRRIHIKLMRCWTTSVFA